MNLYERRFCSIAPALAAFAPMAMDAIGGMAGGGSGGSQPSGRAAAPPPSMQQRQDQETSVNTSVDVYTNLNGAPININIGGAQQADGSLGGGRYLDRGVDAPLLNAPFGTLQSVAEGQEVQWSGWMSPSVTDSGPPVLLIGGVLIVGAVGLALVMRRRHVR